MKIVLERTSDLFHFETTNLKHSVSIDANKEIGGTDKGVRPMQLLLIGLGGCSAIDIISILKKQKQFPEDFKIEIHAEREEETIPSLFKNIHLQYIFKGAELDIKKVKKAIDLSVEKYCSVARILEGTAEITYDFEIIDQLDKISA